MIRWKFIDRHGQDTGRTLFASQAIAEANCAEGETCELADEHHSHDPIATAKRRIVGIEALAGPRALREALLAVLPAGPERDRLKSLDDQIAKLRADVKP